MNLSNYFMFSLKIDINFVLVHFCKHMSFVFCCPCVFVAFFLPSVSSFTMTKPKPANSFSTECRCYVMQVT